MNLLEQTTTGLLFATTFILTVTFSEPATIFQPSDLKDYNKIRTNNKNVNSFPCDCTISQGAFSVSISSMTGTTDAASYYSYGLPTGSSAGTGLEASDIMRFFLYEDPNTGQISLFTLIDLPNDGSGGSGTLDVQCLPPGAFVAVSDDPGELAGTPPNITGNFNWQGCCTDGGVIGGLGCGATYDIYPAITGISAIQWLSGDINNPTILNLPSLTEKIRVNCGGAGVCCPEDFQMNTNVFNASCPNSSDGSINVTPNQGTAPFSYSWSNGAFTQNLSGLPPGAYTVTITDADGCMDIVQATVGFNSNIPNAFPAELSTCSANPFLGVFNLNSIAGDVSGGAGTISWYVDPGATIPIVNTSAYQSGSTTVYAVVSNGSCFSDPVPVMLVVNLQPLAMAFTLNSCDLGFGEALFDLTTAEQVVSGGLGTVIWYIDQFGITEIGSPANYLSPTATVYAIVDDGVCQSEPAPVQLIVTPGPDANPASLQACDTENGQAVFDLTSLEATVSGGSGDVEWFSNPGATAPINNPESFLSGNASVYATVTEGNCTSPPAMVSLQVIPFPVAMSDTLMLCDDGSGSAVFDLTIADTLISAGMGTVDWYSDTSLTMPVAMPDSFPSSTSTLYATVTDSNCVSEPVPVALIILELPAAQSDTLQACDVGGGTAIFDLSAAAVNDDGDIIAWFTDEETTDTLFNPQSYSSSSGPVYATVSNGNCISQPAQVWLEVNSLPAADFTNSPLSVCINEEVTVTYTGSADENNAVFTWNFNGGAVSSGGGAGPYTVSWPGGGSRTITLIVEENNCTSEQFSQTVEVATPLAPPVINCTTTTSTITFNWNDVNGADSYNVTVLAGPAGMQNGNTYEVTGLNPGDGVTIEVEAVGSGPCGNSTATQSCVAEDCPMVGITLDPVADICLDDTAAPLTLNATLSSNTGGGTATWSGPGITDTSAGIFDPGQAGPGMHTISYNYQEGNCTYNNSLTINVFEQPTANFTADSPVCVNQPTDVVYTGSAAAGADYAWSFDGGAIISGTGAGPYEISWNNSGQKTISLTVTENGCSSEAFTATVQVDEPLPEPVVSCATTNTSVTFSWTDVPGAEGYQVVLLSGPSGTQSGISYEVTGLNPGDEVSIEVIAQTSSPCGNSSVEVSCTAQDCPTVTIDIDPVSDQCTDSEAVTLTATAMGGTGGGTYSWAGTGVTDPAGVFDPSAVIAGTHTVTVTYTEGVCTYTASVDISVFAVPTADFTLGGPVCVDEATAVTYSGTATGAATYNWDFDGGAIVSGTGAGPYEISWNSSGQKTVSLTVTEDGCTSGIFTQDIQIDEPRAAPVLSCATTNTSITFSWVDVPGAVGYQVTQLSGPGTGTQVGNSYEVSGLNPGDMVNIEVVALSGGACPDSSTQLECVAQDCPEVSLTIDPVGALCADSEAVTLTATAEGGAGDGTYSWGGSGVTDPSGVFDPTAVIAGTHTVTVVYTEGVCTYSESIDIIVNPVPVAAIELSEGPVCAGDVVTVTFTGTASDNAVYSWNFDGGTADPGTGAGPHEVVWSESGMKTVTLMLEDQGCSAGEGALQSIAVESPLAEPQIICEESLSTSITYSWAAVPGAAGYEVSVVGGPDGILNGTTYTIDNLVPQQEVTIQVTVLSDGPCPNAVGEGSCIAQDCPPLSLALSGTTAVCAGEPADIIFDFTGDSEGPFEVSYTVNDGPEQTITLTDGQGLSLEDLTETTVIEVLSITDNSLSDCVYPGNVSWAVQVSQPVEAGIPADPARVCAGEEAEFNLFELLEGAELGGQWTEVSASPSTGGAFNAAGGTFTTTNQTAGTYTFRYTIDAAAPCPDAQAEVMVRVEPAPQADAGPDQQLTCNMGLVSLGGTSDPDLTYEWSSDNPDAVIADPTSAAIDVSHPGVYTLTVSNDIGCTATDEVEVTAELEVPTAEVSVTDISCFEAGDGIITIANVSGGQGPYQYSLNDGAFSGQTVYGVLSPGSYSLVIRDANGCFTELSVDLSQPDELVVSLTTSLEGDERVIELGDSVRLDAMYNAGIVIDTIMWQPDTLVKGHQASVWVSPTTQTTYSVMVVDENGCRDSDNLTLFVKKDRPVYIPNAFSPNEDGVNDVFYIQAGSQVREVKSFLVFNRWGETMIELYGFQPNDPTYGWDGMHRGQVLNPAVFAWFAEIEFEDGEVILYEGDVMLMR